MRNIAYSNFGIYDHFQVLWNIFIVTYKDIGSLKVYGARKSHILLIGLANLTLYRRLRLTMNE